jgi:hypothetical protein
LFLTSRRVINALDFEVCVFGSAIQLSSARSRI